MDSMNVRRRSDAYHFDSNWIAFEIDPSAWCTAHAAAC